jgi:Kef-type K+ transport system membrane component KefB
MIPSVAMSCEKPTSEALSGNRAAITSLALGGVSGMGLGLFQKDHTIHMLSTFGIVALFLFAGIDVDTDDLRREARVVSQHLGIRLILFGVTAAAVVWILHLEFEPQRWWRSRH